MKLNLPRPPMRGNVTLLVGVSLGAALAAVVIASGAWPPASSATPLQLPPLSLRDNKQQLSSAEMRTLLSWARRYRACAIRHGVGLDPVVAGDNEVLITGPGGSRISRVGFRRQLSCFREMGVPPAFSAFALMRDRRLHLYRPRTCRLPVVASPQG